MALNLFSRFSPRINPATPEYPVGSIKNESVPGARDGTPLDADWGNDYAGFDGALLAAAGLTASGTPDTALVSQRLAALQTIFVDKGSLAAPDSTVVVGGGKASNLLLSFDNMLDLMLYEPSRNGQRVMLASYHGGWAAVNRSPRGGGVLVWDSSRPKSQHNGVTIYDPSAPYPSDFGDIAQQLGWFNSSNVGNGVWRRVYDGAVNAAWSGAKGDRIQDDTIPLQKTINVLSRTEYADIVSGGFATKKTGGKVFIPDGVYRTTDTLLIGEATEVSGVGSPNFPRRDTSNFPQELGTTIYAKFANPLNWVIQGAIYYKSTHPTGTEGELYEYRGMPTGTEYDSGNITRAEGIVIKNIFVIADTTGGSDPYGGIRLASPSFQLDNVGVYGTDVGYWFTSSWGCSATNLFGNTYKWGILIGSGVNALNVSNCYINRIGSKSIVGGDVPKGMNFDDVGQFDTRRQSTGVWISYAYCSLSTVVTEKWAVARRYFGSAVDDTNSWIEASTSNGYEISGPSKVNLQGKRSSSNTENSRVSLSQGARLIIGESYPASVLSNNHNDGGIRQVNTYCVLQSNDHTVSLGQFGQLWTNPQGAIRGSNANGEWTEYADGTLINFKSEISQVANSTAEVTYPSAFVGDSVRPVITGDLAAAAGNYTFGASTARGTFSVIAVGAAGTVTYGYIATGRKWS